MEGEHLSVSLLVAEFEADFMVSDRLNVAPEHLSVGGVIIVSVAFVEQHDVSLAEVRQEAFVVVGHGKRERLDAFVVIYRNNV